MDEEAAVAKAQAMAATVKGLTPDPEASGPAPGPSDESLAAAMAELDMEHYDDSDPEEAGTSSMNRILGSSGNPGGCETLVWSLDWGGHVAFTWATSRHVRF